MLSGCTQNLSIVHPAGPAAAAIATLWWVLLAGAVTIFAFVMVLLALAFRTRGATDSSDHGYERRWILGLGLVFPVTVLGALLVYGLVIGERLMPRAAPELVTVGAEARQWAWRFTYADMPGHATHDILHIPAGIPIDVQITSLDVIHSFWVPRLAGKLDAIPGHVNVLRIEADVPGEYAGVSAEFSGVGYRMHDFTVIAHDAEGWSAFIAGETP
jgi:heme/copper-type cytochrome/quinol oxidase subunit 2